MHDWYLPTVYMRALPAHRSQDLEDLSQEVVTEEDEVDHGDGELGGTPVWDGGGGDVSCLGDEAASAKLSYQSDLRIDTVFAVVHQHHDRHLHCLL